MEIRPFWCERTIFWPTPLFCHAFELKTSWYGRITQHRLIELLNSQSSINSRKGELSLNVQVFTPLDTSRHCECVRGKMYLHIETERVTCAWLNLPSVVWITPVKLLSLHFKWFHLLILMLSNMCTTCSWIMWHTHTHTRRPKHTALRLGVLKRRL